MKIAVTYGNGDVFQHFGRTEQFKIYDVSGSRVTDSRVIGTDGFAHEGLTQVLKNQGIDVLICGGLGMGARNAIAASGIQLTAGASGNADKAVEEYLAGTLVTGDGSCHDHDHEHHHGAGHVCHN